MRSEFIDKPTHIVDAKLPISHFQFGQYKDINRLREAESVKPLARRSWLGVSALFHRNSYDNGSIMLFTYRSVSPVEVEQKMRDSSEWTVENRCSPSTRILLDSSAGCKIVTFEQNSGSCRGTKHFR